uniref:Protein zer-1 homolog n=1 Tax=Hirondellea gigas TaxID=1518452 RepID=A0A2P2HVY8_9CRUS
MTGAQGHPGWVDNHPTSLKFLAASQVCCNPSGVAKLRPTIREETDSNTTAIQEKSRNVDNTEEDMPDADIVIPEKVSRDDSSSGAHTIKADPSISFSAAQLNSENGSYDIHEGICLSQNIADFLLATLCRNHPLKANQQFLTIFNNLERCKITTANLRGTKAADISLSSLMKHNLKSIDIRDCENISSKAWEHICNWGTYLTSLAVDKNVMLNVERGLLELNMRNLLSLTMHHVTMPNNYFSTLFNKSNFKNLSYLDLSGCGFLEDISFLANYNLSNLTLYNCNFNSGWIKSICKIKTLRKLDISRCKTKLVTYTDPELKLCELIQSLPNLCYLDISGTNLTGELTPTKVNDEETGSDGITDIAPLACRVFRPLDVLGLCHTSTDACKWNNIPAIKVMGDASEEQILNTVELQMVYREQVTSALNELFHQFRYDRVNNVEKALRLIFSAMSRYHYDESIQISGSASLFYIMRAEAEARHPVHPAARQQMITLMINAMERFPKDNILMRNGCLTISQLKVPQQVLFEYERLVKLLLNLIRRRGNYQPALSDQQHNMCDFVCRISIYLLNSLACQVEGPHKLLVGDLGAVETMLGLIREKLGNGTHDDILELAWSVMWNVTDETPANCRRFLDGDGMEYFSNCLTAFSEHEDLLRNMMGLLGNVAEVDTLRPRLMTTPLISTFTSLLKSESGGIEVSYNAAGVLSHIASDGPDAWSIEAPTRASVLSALTDAISQWNITVRRNINYRSFEPILRLVSIQHTPQCQHWAAWGLANLTRVYPDKYCSLVVDEGGLEILEGVLSQKPDISYIAMLVQRVIDHCKHYQRDGNLLAMYTK